MTDELAAQLKRLKKMGINIDIPEDTPEQELSNVLAQIDDQLTELTRLAELELDSEEPATLANMSALAIDVNVQVDALIAALGQASAQDGTLFADDGLAILFAELRERALALTVSANGNDTARLVKRLNACLDKHGLAPIHPAEIDAIDHHLASDSDNIYEQVDAMWLNLCQALNERGLSLIQFITPAGETEQHDHHELHLIALAEPASRKWTNRGFGQHALLAFSELFLTD